MMFINFLLVGTFATLAELRCSSTLHGKNKTFIFLQNTVFINLFSLFLLRFVLQKDHLFLNATYTMTYSVKYVLFAMVIALGFLFMKYQIHHSAHLKECKKPRTKSERRWLIADSVMFLIGWFLLIGTDWFHHFFGSIASEQFMFNFTSPVSGAAHDLLIDVVDTQILLYVTGAVVFLTFLWAPVHVVNKYRTPLPNGRIRKIGGVIAAFLLFISSIYAISTLRLDEVIHSLTSKSSYIENNYVAPDSVALTFPKEKRNLVHIYLESMENSYLDASLGGNSEHNLLPDLTTLAQEGIHFSENKPFGGPYQTYGSSWTMASIVNMTAGLPIKIATDANAYGKKDYFLPGATTMSDILTTADYNQLLIVGSPADFSGMSTYYQTHGNTQILDYQRAKETQRIPEEYYTWWGFEDQKLFQFAKEELTRLSGSDQPFALTLQTMDTHFPDGYVDPHTPTKYENQYANVVAHSQKQVTDFVRWMQKQPFYKDTTIVLTGDHLSMDKAYFDQFPKDYQRSTFNLILNGATSVKTTKRAYAPFDYFPTILASIGMDIPNHRLGLGTDLTSTVPTLIERDGFKKVHLELARKSNFYNQELLTSH
ncbi:LTA synthase family protein [Enterococcus saccharolyticus]|uniref:LTA synthase family protein n=1 Tax=Enterococcus saccharolyticus TaxID=41997 RepID=UPI0039DFC29D